MKNSEDARRIYSDIIDLPYPKSKNRKHMLSSDRAAQFAAFKALSGFEDMISENSRLIVSRIEMDDDRRDELDKKLRFLEKLKVKKPIVTFVYFVPDKYKQGGMYKTISDIIRKVDSYKRIIVTESGDCIPVDDIYNIICDEYDMD